MDAILIKIKDKMNVVYLVNLWIKLTPPPFPNKISFLYYSEPKPSPPAQYVPNSWLPKVLHHTINFIACMCTLIGTMYVFGLHKTVVQSSANLGGLLAYQLYLAGMTINSGGVAMAIPTGLLSAQLNDNLICKLFANFGGFVMQLT